MKGSMGSEAQRHVEKFGNAVDGLPDLWRSVDVRVLAVRVSGMWRNVFTRCRLLPQNPPRSADHTIYNDGTIACFRDVLPIAELPSLLGELQSGVIEFESGEVSYLQRSLSGEGPLVPYEAYFEFYDADRPYSVYNQYPLGVGALRLMCTGRDTTDALLRSSGVDMVSFNQRLRISNRPIDGLDALSRFVADRRASISQSSHIEFIAPFEISIVEAQSSLKRGELHVMVKSSSKRYARYCAINVFSPDAQASPVGGQIKLPARQWKRVATGWEAHVSTRVGFAREVRLLLICAGWEADQCRVRDFTSTPNNPRVAAYHVFDNDLEILGGWLRQSGTRNSKHFELGIGRLLMLCGYQVDTFIESRQFTEGVDVVAHSPHTDTVLAVECTLASLDSGGKLGKLIARANQIQGELAGKNIQRVVCTAMSISDISNGEIERAASEQISVLGADEITELLSFATGGASFEVIEQYILSHVPESQQQSFY